MLPGGVAADLYRNSKYASLGEDVAVAAFQNIVDTQGKPLSEGLKVALLTDRKTRTSLHEAVTGIPLATLLQQPPGAAAVQVHQVALSAGESLNLVVVIPQQDRVEAEVNELRGKVAETFDRCKKRVEEISHRVRLKTPDALIDLGTRSLCVSMDALWLPPVFMHGPIRWGFPGLMGWRMAYGADVCGNYDRVASHCKFYGDARMQGGLDRKPHADPAAALAAGRRQLAV